MNLKGIPVIIIFCIALAVPVQSQKKDKKSNTVIGPLNVELADEPAVILGGIKITLGEAIKQAIERNHDIIAGSYEVAMTDTMYQMFQRKYAFHLNVDAGYLNMKFLPSQQFFYGKDENKVDGTASLYKSFSTGTTVIAGVNHAYSKLTRDQTANLIIPGITAAMGPSSVHRPQVFITVQQELLKNAFGYSDRKQEKILKNAAKMQREAILFQLSLVVVGVIADYWNVVVNKSQMDNAELLVKATRNVRNITGRNVKFGMMDNFNLNYYNALLAGAEAQYAMAKQKYRDALRTFLATINMDDTVDVSGTAVFSGKMKQVNVEAALKTAFKKRSDYRNAVLALENAQMGLNISRSSLLPSLKAEVNVAALAENGSFSGAYADAFSGKYPAFEGRIRLSYPLYDKGLITDRRNARFRLKQAQIQLEKYKRSVKNDVVSKAEGIQTSYTIYQKAKKARKQSELFYRRMLANLRRGRLNAATVNNGLNALVQGRNQELQALVYYNVSLLMFDVAKNELFEKYKIDVNKYIPKK